MTLRTVSSKTDVEIVKKITKPRYCIQLDWNQTGFGVERWCTAGEVSWNGFTWYYKSVEVKNLTIDVQEARATVDYLDNDQSFRVLALSTKLLEAKLDIWKLYGTAPYVSDDGEHLFSGTIDSIKGKSYNITLEINATGLSQFIIPKASYGPPNFNFIPEPGSILQVGRNTIRIDSR